MPGIQTTGGDQPRANTSSTGLNQLEQLKQFTTVVADTGDFASLRAYSPRDATTNPTLILKAAQMPDYSWLLDKALAEHRQSPLPREARVKAVSDRLLILFGVEILKIIPGRVSTETAAEFSFDIQALVNEARNFIASYAQEGMGRERVLIKIASTWEGIRAAEILEREGIHCNMTLLFCLPQAVEAADAGARLISPFVGRILDWHKKSTGKDYAPPEDPGVLSVREIYSYYKKYGYPTEVMGASFRNVGEILELAGCDLLTISPNLLQELSISKEPVPCRLSPESAATTDLPRLKFTESEFRFRLNENAMASEKLAEGIRLFAGDSRRLQEMVAKKL